MIEINESSHEFHAYLDAVRALLTARLHNATPDAVYLDELGRVCAELLSGIAFAEESDLDTVVARVASQLHAAINVSGILTRFAAKGQDADAMTVVQSVAEVLEGLRPDYDAK